MSRWKKTVVVVAVALFAVQGLLSRSMFPTWEKNYSAHNVGVVPGLSIDQLLASVAGLREMVAGILWVQSDEFFHSGQFDAILPVVRLVTWLNPRQIEVYSTGAWHIGYNFTDEQQRSDRRYIPLALRLLEDGVANNPNTYELYHDTGWMYFHKIDDNYAKAVEWFQKSVSMPDIQNTPALRGILASAYQRTGQIEEALNWYWKLQQESLAQWEKTKNPMDWNRKDTNERNVDNTIVRMIARGYFGKRDGVFDKFPYETQKPLDLKFSAKVSVLEPKLIRVTGTWGIPVTGARVRMMLHDEDFNLLWEAAPTLDFDRDKGRTYLYDLLYTQNGRFDRKIDMSRNPTMYPLKSQKYYLDFYFNPRSAPPHIQDRLGWTGEGMTDKRYLNTSERPGERVLFCRLEMTRDQLLHRGAGPFVVATPGYKEIATRFDEDVIVNRSLRTQ
jgi:hypothetical protein